MRSQLKHAHLGVLKLAVEVSRRCFIQLEDMHLELTYQRYPRPVRLASLDSRPSAHEALTSEHARINSAPCPREPHALSQCKMAS